MNKIIFVCTGNTCRSPMAQMIMNNFLQEYCIDDIQVISRGLSVFEPLPVSNHVHTLMAEYHIDSSAHRSKLLSIGDLTDNTLILTMTQNHKMHVCTLFPNYASQIYTLAEYTTESHFDIYDPYAGSIDMYRKCYLLLEELVQKLVEKTCLHYKKDVY